MQLAKSGAYVADSLGNGDLDFSEWQFWHMDPSMQIETKRGYVKISGVSSTQNRCFTGLVSRKLHPPSAVLTAEMRVPCGLSQAGKYGFVVHHCNRLVGNDVRTRGIPDNNCEIAFGRTDSKVGWFRWYFDHMRNAFCKWNDTEVSFPPFGDEQRQFRLVRVSYQTRSGIADCAIHDGSRWIRLGSVGMMKHFSSIELKIDCMTAGIELEAHFRNCRMFPHPADVPLKVFVGDSKRSQMLASGSLNPYEAPVRIYEGAEVVLTGLNGHTLASGRVAANGIAEVWLPEDEIYPLSARIEVFHEDTRLAMYEAVSDGLRGIYPGDFYGTFESMEP